LPTVESDEAPPAKKRSWIGFVIGFVVIAALVAVGIVIGPQLFAAAPTSTSALTEESASPTDSIEQGAPTSTLPLAPTFTLAPSITPTSTATFTPVPTPRGGGDQIAFASNRSGEVQIWLLSIADGELFQMTDIVGGACQPTWSPDGQQLVFIAPCSRNQQTYPGSSLFIVNADGSNMNPLPSSPIGDFDPDWSPVDNRILFTTLRDFNRAQVWILDIDTGESYNVSNNVASDSQPTWSPDGELIAFVSTRVINRGQIWMMDTQGENVIEYSRSSNRTNLEPAWAPDGGLVVYTQFGIRGGGVPNLMGNFWDGSGTTSGTNEFRITDDPSEMRETDFSPDGRWITFASNPDYADLEIFLMRVNGSELTQLTSDDAEDFDPAWRPAVP
jgi:Tol biopolymer transport system component